METATWKEHMGERQLGVSKNRGNQVVGLFILRTPTKLTPDLWKQLTTDHVGVLAENANHHPSSGDVGL